MRSLIQNAALRLSRRKRESRAEFFRRAFNVGETTKILDLGSQDGEHLQLVLGDAPYNPRNVYLADLNVDGMASAANKCGFNVVRIGTDDTLPFEDGFFDIVFCSSVIEHVTGPKEDMWQMSKTNDFAEEASRQQRRFAQEISRVGKCFFVQTPNRNFPIESHTWLPLVQFLPRRWLIALVRFSNRFWIFYTTPDFRLLTRRDMAELFPEAAIVVERSFGLAKSIMAIKNR